MKYYYLLFSCVLTIIGLLLVFANSGFNYNENNLNNGIGIVILGLFLIFLFFVRFIGKS